MRIHILTLPFYRRRTNAAIFHCGLAHQSRFARIRSIQRSSLRFLCYLLL